MRNRKGNRLYRVAATMGCLVVAMVAAHFLRTEGSRKRIAAQDVLQDGSSTDNSPEPRLGVVSNVRKRVATVPPPFCRDSLFELGNIRQWMPPPFIDGDQYTYRVSRFAFYRDGTPAYVLKVPDYGECVVVANEPGPFFYHIAEECTTLSPSGDILEYKAWAMRRIGRKDPWLDIVVAKTFHQVWPPGVSPYFSPDGRRVAVVVQPNWYLPWDWQNPAQMQAYVLIDGKQSELFDVPPHVVFSPDSKRYLYFGKVGNTYVMVVDGVRREIPFGPRSAVFSPDSKKIAYAVEEARSSGLARRCYMMVDNERADEYDFNADRQPCGDEAPFSNVLIPYFLPGATRPSYVAKDDEGKWVIVHDGRKVKLAESASRSPSVRLLGVAPDGSPLYRDDLDYCFYVGETERSEMIVNGEKHRILGDLCPMVSLDGKRMAYRAEKEGGKMVVIVEDSETVRSGEEFSWISSFPVFSPDGTHVVYCAKDGDKYFVVVNDIKLQEPYEAPIECIYFSPDSEKLFFGAFDGKDLWWHTVTLEK